jgi:hypothetical protein
MYANMPHFDIYMLLEKVAKTDKTAQLTSVGGAYQGYREQCRKDDQPVICKTSSALRDDEPIARPLTPAKAKIELPSCVYP